MCDIIAHRGPDDEGQYVDGNLGLGHRRLAILDLSSAAHQPMLSKDQRYVLVYNGEIYNFRELRLELQSMGHGFHSSSDTEVLLAAWSEWGEACVPRLNGMFAFAIWDREQRELSFARDRYGIKPLYLYRGANALVFGSEVKAMLPSGVFTPQVDTEALLEYFTFQNFLTDRTLFKDVTLFPAGHTARVGQDGKLRMSRYWDYHFEESPMDEAEAQETLDGLFRQAVSRQLVSDVPVGTYLSGGMDSASITMAASKQIESLTSFTIGFDLRSASGLELRYDEREQAEHISYLAGTEHYEMVLKAGDMERCMSRLVWHLEEPRVGQCYPNYYACRLGSRFVKVILAGMGGDELFGGYPWRYYRTVGSRSFDEFIHQYYGYWQRLIPNRIIHKVFAPIQDQVKGVWTEDIFRGVFADHADKLTRPEDYVNHSLYFEAKTFLHGLFAVEDKLSMAHGLEARVPFMDNDLVDFAQRVPVRLKLRDLDNVVRLDENSPGRKKSEYAASTNDGKLLLRSTLARYMPDSVTNARKQGFSAPDASWFKGESIDYVRERLCTPNAHLYDYLDYREVQSLVADHLDGRTNRRLLIWSLLYVEEWLRQFIHSDHGYNGLPS